MSASRLVVERKEFLSALAAVMPAVRHASKTPILSAVRITATSTGSTVEADNLDLALRVSLTGRLVGPASASVVISAKRLQRAVRRGLPAGDVTITLDRKRPSVSAGTTTVWLDALPVDEWPKRPPLTGETVTLSADDVAVIKRLVVAASTDWARPILTSVEIANGFAVATDSYRLIAARISATPSRPVLLPAPTAKVLPGEGCEFVVGASSDGPASWGDDRAGGWTRLVMGEFPKWQGLMPAEPGAPLVLDRGPFLAAVLRAEAIISEFKSDAFTSDAPILLTPVAGGITIGARCGTEALFAEELVFDGLPAAPPIAVNARFLAELLRIFIGERIRLFVRDPLKPILMTEDTDDAGALRALLMPVRTTDMAEVRRAS